MAARFSWLHLTDFHFGLHGQDFRWSTLRKPFLEDLAKLHDACGPWDAVFFTGDFVQKGKSDEFREMQTEVLDPVWKKLDELGSGDAILLGVPGNHDLYRPNANEDNPAIDVLLEAEQFPKIADKFWDRPTGAYRKVISDAFAAYTDWWKDAPHRPPAAEFKTSHMPGDFAYTHKLASGQQIGVIGLNTTFLQLARGDYEGKLVWDPRQLHAVCGGDIGGWSDAHDHCILLTHQGPKWMTNDGIPEITPAGRFALHLFGHQHETEITYLSHGGGEAIRRCQGSSVFGMEKHGDPPKFDRVHGYAAGTIEFADGGGASLRLWPRIATDKPSGWRFIPDSQNAVLEPDGGTAPDPLSPPKVKATRPSPTIPVPTLPAPRTPHSTLPRSRPFFGRAEELKKVAKYLDPKDRSWGVVIDGPGGVGKTALGLEAAHRAPAEHFPLKLWITAKSRDLKPDGERQKKDLQVTNYHDLLNELGRALCRDDIPKARPEERPGLVRLALAEHRVLLVLDNLETFSDEERRRLFDLLAELPASCRAIVTSRRRTDGSVSGHFVRLDKLDKEAAYQLLQELGERQPPVAKMTTTDRDRLYEETGGNPLLLTWTAGQLGRPTGRCKTVDAAIERLREAHKHDPDNDPLEYIFGDLLDTFGESETKVLAALVHFTEPAQLKWLPPMTKLSQTAAETALDGLRDRALLVEDEAAGTWLLPPLAKRFLRLVQPKIVKKTGGRLADRVYALVVENGYEEFKKFPKLEEAWPEIAAGLPLLIAGENRRLQTLCDALYTFLNFSGRWDEWLSLELEGEAKAERANDWSNAGWRAYQAGYCHNLRAESAEILECAERAAVHWKQARAGAREQSAAIELRGHGYRVAKEYPAAIAAYEEALALDRSLSRKSEDVSITLNWIGEAYVESKQFDKAESYYREALAMAKEISDTEGVATYTGNLAALELDRENWPESESLTRETLKLAEDLGRLELIGLNCRNLAEALARQGRGEEGASHAERAAAIFAKLRHPHLKAVEEVLEECRAAS